MHIYPVLLLWLLAVFASNCASSRKKEAEIDSSIDARKGAKEAKIDSSIDAGKGAIESDADDEDEKSDVGVNSGLDVMVFDTGVDRAVAEEGTSLYYPPCEPNCPELEWVLLPAGVFMMGDPEFSPQREVSVPGFMILKTKVTVAQYRLCVEAGACKEPVCTFEVEVCNSNLPDRDQYPVNGISWEEAQAFGEWVGGRLPSEAEWEYAARSGGQDIKYPWGNEEPTCEHAVLNFDPQLGCRPEDMMEVCSKPLGNTAQGLCDMVGNLKEWVADVYHSSYEGAPSDGIAWLNNPDPYMDWDLGYGEIPVVHLTRSCSIYDQPWYCTCTYKSVGIPNPREYYRYGFRVAQNASPWGS